MDEHQLMHAECRCVAAVHSTLMSNVSATLPNEKSLLSTVGLTDRAI